MENINNKTGEVIQIPTVNVSSEEKTDINNYQKEISKIIGTAGTTKLTDEQSKILLEEIKDEEILIRPDGLVYAPWYLYAGRLNRAFTGLGWALVPQGMPKHDTAENVIYWGFHMVINGIYIDFAIGQNEYQPDSFTMKYGDCCEGAKSNALMRICKKIGMFHKLWDHEFVERWKTKYAYIKEWKTLSNGKKRPIWVKKSSSQTTPLQPLHEGSTKSQTKIISNSPQAPPSPQSK